MNKISIKLLIGAVLFFLGMIIVFLTLSFCYFCSDYIMRKIVNISEIRDDYIIKKKIKLAETEAETNRIINDSLTDEILDYSWYKSLIDSKDKKVLYVPMDKLLIEND